MAGLAAFLVLSALVVTRFLFAEAGPLLFSLDGAWNFTNTPKGGDNAKTGIGNVPGDIFTDLKKAGLIDEPLYSDNDKKLRWVARENWTYSKKFSLDDHFLERSSILLEFDGLDTVADVLLNGNPILRAQNQFVKYTVDVTKQIKNAENLLEVAFLSPIDYVEAQSKKYERNFGHSIPPECTPEIFHGECRPNFIRKMQASFSWDWGPAFPTVGVWLPARLVAFDEVYLQHLTATATRTTDDFEVEVTAEIRRGLSLLPSKKVELLVAIPELGIKERTKIEFTDKTQFDMQLTLKVPRSQVELWWPNGYGVQKLYLIEAKLHAGGEFADSKAIKFGFRHVELVQDFVDEGKHQNGRHFFFRVNDVPVFLKGTNWIPIHALPAQNHSARLEFLLESSRVAGMNAMRVWGGGRYESDEFYELADQKGILIWQDFMFACNLYPADQEFLNSVMVEVKQQVNRLKSHPSILLFAGNNENELGLRGGWFYAQNYSRRTSVFDEQMDNDYKLLYKDTMLPLVTSLDKSREYLLSSPSNGIETFKAGGISPEPGSSLYGDVHFYNEFLNMWKDATYPTPRCATEYGLQSVPVRSTMLRWLNDSDFNYFSPSMTWRQHHPGGEMTLLTMIFSHFPMPNGCDTERRNDGAAIQECVKNEKAFSDRFVYFTQLHQAIAYKAETEHYLRHQGRLLEDGRGNTMCALYWQLNDVWAAPTWSTIDFELRWKPAHYEVKRFFSPTIVSLYLDGNNNLEAFVVNSRASNLTKVKIEILTLAWTNGFLPVDTIPLEIDVPAHTSVRLDIGELNSRNMALNTSVEDFVFQGKLLLQDGTTYETTALPDKLYHVDLAETGTVKIDSITRVSIDQFKISITASAIAPFVWLDVVRPLAPPFYFSDNAFTMTSKRRELLLQFSAPIHDELTLSDVSVCALKDCYV